MSYPWSVVRGPWPVAAMRAGRGSWTGDYAELSRVEDLATSNGPSPDGLCAGEEAAARGVVRAVGSNSKGGGFDSSEHRGGAGPTAYAGVPPAPIDRAGQSGGVGHLAHGRRTSWILGHDRSPDSQTQDRRHSNAAFRLNDALIRETRVVTIRTTDQATFVRATDHGPRATFVLRTTDHGPPTTFVQTTDHRPRATNPRPRTTNNG